jgi:hypothetical protein
MVETKPSEKPLPAEAFELAVKLRDAHQMAADALSEWLERQGPKEEHHTQSEPKDPHKYDPLPWEKKKGARGIYDQTSQKLSQNSSLWQELAAWLQKNKGKARLGDYFYWTFENDPTIVGRKELKPKA